MSTVATADTKPTPIWPSTEAMVADSVEFSQLTGSIPTMDQLIAFARLKAGGDPTSN